MLTESGLTVEQVNGHGFQSLREGENLKAIEKALNRRVNERILNRTFGTQTTIGSNANAGRLTVPNRDGGENANAHRYAAKNLKSLYENARIVVRHLDKNHVDQLGSKAPHYLRVIAPFCYEGKLYVAIISQRDPDNQTPGIHAIEALDVVEVRDAPVYSSGPDRNSVRSRHTDASPGGKDESRLTEDKIAYTIEESKLDPRHLDGMESE